MLLDLLRELFYPVALSMVWLAGAGFIFYYPVLMSMVWVVGGLFFYWRYERKPRELPQLKEYPMVSILIPARNEEESIAETVEAALEQDYPNFEIIVINDASTDNTGPIVEELARKYEKVRALSFMNNLGKAAALNAAFLLTNGEIIMAIDADCLLDPHALRWMAYHFVTYPRVGAVTGNPRVRNRTTLLAKIQAAEYSSVIGLIKRTQRTLGKVLTISGVVSAFRKPALMSVGLWSTDMVTEDIDVTWKLEKKFWAIHYELNAIAWILVPETLGGYWKQRVRWAQGGIEVLRRHASVWKDSRTVRLWPLYIDYFFSVLWAFTFVLQTLGWVILVSLNIEVPEPFRANPFPFWNGSIAALVCLIQFAVSLYIDRGYDSSLPRYYFWVIWYPIFYWIFSSMACIRATPKAMTKKAGTLAIWTSPDRGIRSTVVK